MRVLNTFSEINISRILRLIWLEKKISRVEIATRLGMDKSTVTKIATELSQKKIIKEAESGESGPQGGRKPVFLELNSDYACTAGIEINPQKIYCTVLNLNGQVIYEYSEEINPIEYKKLRPVGYFKKAYKIIIQFTKQKNINLLGIGVGLPALVNVEEGKIIQSIPLMIYEPIEFISIAKEFTQLPVFLDNDARCCCYTEKTVFQNSTIEKNMMYVLVQYRPQQPIEKSPENISVGFGFVLNGKIYRGTSSTAGEFRSMLWDSSSKSQFLTETDAAVKLSDSIMQTIFKELAKNIAFLVNTLNLDIVYVGGIEKKCADDIVKYIQENIAFLWPYEWNTTSFVTSTETSDRVVSVGAATQVLDNIFSVPELSEGNNNFDFWKNMSAYQWLTSKH